jgi:ribosomal protein S18 acetylase RimI-like enzyme
MVIRPATWADLADAVELLGAQSRAASGIAGMRIEHLRSEWNLPGFELGRDNLVAEEGERIAGYVAVTPRQELAIAAQDEALADLLLARAVERARERGDTVLTVTVRSPDDPLLAVVERHPFVLERETLLMWRPLGVPVEAPRFPDGVVVRTYAPADGTAVHRLLDTAYGSWDDRYIPVSHADWERSMTGDDEFDAALWWLAERDGRLVGCALHWTSAWLKDLAVEPGERGAGLGSALVQQGLAEFSGRGARRVGLKVDAANPTGAVRLYERLGFATASREAVWAIRL